MDENIRRLERAGLYQKARRAKQRAGITVPYLPIQKMVLWSRCLADLTFGAYRFIAEETVLPHMQGPPERCILLMDQSSYGCMALDGLWINLKESEIRIRCPECQELVKVSDVEHHVKAVHLGLA